MKIIIRIVLAVFWGIVFVVGYTLMTACLFGFKVVSEPVAEFIGLPITFAYYAYKLGGGNDSSAFVDDNTVLFFSAIFSVPIVLYSIIAYILHTIYSKLLLPKPEAIAPPLPPERFD